MKLAHEECNSSVALTRHIRSATSGCHTVSFAFTASSSLLTLLLLLLLNC
jgi:hypothetical protein